MTNEGIATGLMRHGETKAIALFERGAELKRAEYEMAPAMIEALDPFDAEAIRAAGKDPRHTIEQYLVLSTNRFAVVLAGGQLAAMCGTLVRINDRTSAEAGIKTPACQFWLFTTTHVGLAPIRTRKLIRHVARELLKYYDGLYGYIDARHERMIRFCEWIGGELEEPFPFGDVGGLFRKFTIRSS